MFAVGGMGWLTALAVASAAVGRITPDGRPTVLGLACCTGIAVAISAATGLSECLIIRGMAAGWHRGWPGRVGPLVVRAQAP